MVGQLPAFASGRSFPGAAHCARPSVDDEQSNPRCYPHRWPQTSIHKGRTVHELQTVSLSFDLIYLKTFSFKRFVFTCSTTLEETEHQMFFIRHLERALGVKAAPGVDSDLSVVSRYLVKYALGYLDNPRHRQVENYGMAGTYGLRTDFRYSVNHGARLMTSLVYLTDVTAGSALI